MKAYISLACCAFIIAGCADNPVTPEEHFEARGVVVQVADSNVVTVDSNRVTGSIQLDSARVSAFALKFITVDGAVAIPDHEHNASGISAFGLLVEVADTTVAAVSAMNDHVWTMTLTGRRAGTTTVRIHLLHGGHDDFVSVPIPIVVRP